MGFVCWANLMSLFIGLSQNLTICKHCWLIYKHSWFSWQTQLILLTICNHISLSWQYASTADSPDNLLAQLILLTICNAWLILLTICKHRSFSWQSASTAHSPDNLQARLILLTICNAWLILLTICMHSWFSLQSASTTINIVTQKFEAVIIWFPW